MEYKVLVIQYDGFLSGYCKEQDMSAENYYLNERKQFWKTIKKNLDYKGETDTLNLLILSDFDIDITDYKQELLAEGFYFASKSNWGNNEIIEEADKKLSYTQKHVKVLLEKEKIGDGEIELRGICIVENGLYEKKDTEIKEKEIKKKEMTEKQNQKLPENRKAYQKQASLAKLMKALTEGGKYDELQE